MSPLIISRMTPPPTPVTTPTKADMNMPLPSCFAAPIPTEVNTPSPIESITRSTASKSTRFRRSAERMREKKITIAEQTAIIRYSGCCSACGGVLPSSRSRIIPPPTAVVAPSIATPRISIRFSMPTSAPDMANAIVPIISSISVTVSVILPPPFSVKIRSCPRRYASCAQENKICNYTTIINMFAYFFNRLIKKLQDSSNILSYEIIFLKNA